VANQELTTNYTYDEANRLETLTGPNGKVTEYTYDANGNRESLAYPNGTQTTYTYDELNRLSSLTTTGPSGVIQSYGFTLGSAGNREKIEEAGGTVREYQYDELYRLTREKITETASLLYEKSFEYDPVGNRLSQTTAGLGASFIEYDYDGRDRLETENATIYGWDDDGNLTSKSGEAAYFWDYENRLVRVEKADGTVVTHAYDADGNRVRTEITPATGPPTVTDYLVDTSGTLSHVVAETDESGDLIAHYVRGVDDLVSVIRPTEQRFYHADGLGSIRHLSDDSGGVTDSYTYTAFGEELGRIGADTQPYRFAGEPLDANVGFYYNRARWMDPRTGRFTGMDPFAGMFTDPISLHKYTYGRNDPSNSTDPTGFFSLAGAATSMTVMTTIATIAITIFTLANVAIAGGKPSGWMASLRLNVGARGGLATGGVDAVRDLNGRIWVSLAGEAGLSPITLFKKHRFGYSGALGPVFNLNAAEQLSGIGTSAVWPSSAIRLLFGVLRGKNEAYGVLTRLAQGASRRFVFEFGLSSSGPSFFLIGLYSNSFQATVSYNSGFVPVDRLPEAIREEISLVTDALKSAGELDTDGVNWGGAFFRILDTLQSQ
jgi:RHS repeat-associated protein